MDTLNRGDYAANLNTKFRVTGLDESPEIELTAVSELKSFPGHESFSLVFEGGKERLLPQGSYNLEHDSLGSGTIFLVPVDETEDNYLYEAVFNRITTEDKNVGKSSTAG